MEWMVENYPKTYVPAWALYRSDEELKHVIHGFLGRIPGHSSPGIPWMMYASTNSLLLASMSVEIEQAVYERVKLILSLEDNIRRLSPRLLIMLGVMDPVRLFVKDEPHTMAKALQQRWRLISSVSVVDNLVQRLAYTIQDEAEILCWNMTPSKPGIGFDAVKVGQLFECVEGHYPVQHSDISGWDWSVKSWEFDWDSERRIRLAQQKSPVFETLIKACAYCTSFSVYATSDSALHLQGMRGIQNSGAKNTASTNSSVRVMAAIIVAIRNKVQPWAIAMGDDCLETPSADCVARYAEIGHLLREKHVSNSGFSFCSQKWDRVLWQLCVKEGKEPFARPENLVKMLYRILSKPYDVALKYAFLFETRHSLDCMRAWQCLIEVGWDLEVQDAAQKVQEESEN